ncbi:hypothetical protein TRM7557_02015 [Tritonibacter multivorans]|uniref:Uncharacterized protein n=1 Tax=Tritonibacter multivorans TaxID=928856 RepID=A0A0P1GSS6_9RHOB|nr:hypothetical protein TRM7557_02015 [Tritonibacter multivorans]SFD68066.1 hypothetical protein SAMN04488049_1219 [Tritonibacter multivorans]
MPNLPTLLPTLSAFAALATYLAAGELSWWMLVAVLATPLLIVAGLAIYHLALALNSDEGKPTGEHTNRKSLSRFGP